MSGEPDRVTVSTYVPGHQRDRWREHAENLGMSQSEFVRTMVQAGRRGFSLEGDKGTPEEVGSSGSEPGGNGLKMAVQDVLRERGPLDWDELVDELAGDFEDQIDEALTELQNANRVQHRGRQGGYVLQETDDGG